MIKKVEHIGIAVLELEKAIILYENLLNTPCYKIEEVGTEFVKTAFFQLGASKIELVAATKQTSPIAKFITKRGKGLHHIAFEVDNIEEEINRLLGLNYQLIQQNKKRGADNKLIAFLHPKSTNGVLVELCQDIC